MPTNRWTNQLLDEMRQVGDPLADAVITTAVESYGIPHLNKIMRSLVENEEIILDDLPPTIHDYLEQTAHLPEWADLAMIEQGGAFFDLHWTSIVTLLFCASLPSAYAAGKGAQVLYLTQRLTNHVDRRIFETAQFILNVMAPGAFKPHGRAIPSIQKVRLMHAAIRHTIEYVPTWQEQWDPAWGMPINQEDLAGTLMTFSIQVLLGLKRFHIPVTADEEAAYLHTWKVVGHNLGIRPELLPAGVAEAYDLASTIFNRQMAPSEAGVELTKALLDFMVTQTPGKLFDGLPRTTIRHSIDKPVADMLGVPRSNWTVLLLWLEELYWWIAGRFVHRHPRGSKLLQWFSYALVQELVKIERGGNRPLFTIPATLRQPI
ncbi:MAG: DUF2236 domain-containing protein [Chloroflexi bacterium]|nr:DUF2236 domain-containing protein [Chloroflexota bacterium]MCI0644724.1 DUF2236 domain-containing protein [Chloroflexota bacterium]MCI0726697.1 DUF2236 domain-containing protein [Chloroflexota bacterium]